jgi:hypothetical protein
MSLQINASKEHACNKVVICMLVWAFAHDWLVHKTEVSVEHSCAIMLSQCRVKHATTATVQDNRITSSRDSNCMYMYIVPDVPFSQSYQQTF